LGFLYSGNHPQTYTRPDICLQTDTCQSWLPNIIRALRQGLKRS
jgi:hypothetical protein